MSIGQALNVIRKAADAVGVDIQLVYDRNEYEKEAAAQAEASQLAEMAVRRLREESEIAAQLAGANAKRLLELREIAARQDARISAKAENLS